MAASHRAAPSTASSRFQVRGGGVRVLVSLRACVPGCVHTHIHTHTHTHIPSPSPTSPHAPPSIAAWCGVRSAPAAPPCGHGGGGGGVRCSTAAFPAKTPTVLAMGMDFKFYTPWSLWYVIYTENAVSPLRTPWVGT